jgi:hypothetical protein
LPGYLRNPLRPDEARALLGAWAERREADFLGLIQAVIYANPDNPYRRLLALAGCEAGDFERLVRQEGIEATLEALLRRGVYLSVNEFKGRQPVVRGSTRFEVQPRDLAQRARGIVGTNQSSGSRGARTVARFSLPQMRNTAAGYGAELAARGGSDWVKAIWDVPGGAIGAVLRFSGFGAPLARWFALVEAARPGLDRRYRLAELALTLGSRLAGVPLPRPEPVEFEQPLPIARWMQEVLRAGGVPHLYAFLSPAMRLCQRADEAGLDLSGAQFTVTGEPFTPARQSVFQRVGAVAISRYGIAEIGHLGSGCLAPAWSDDHHLPDTRTAVIQAGSAGAALGFPPDALFGSTLRPLAPFCVLNLSTGDQARIVRRACGCPMESFGWTRHLYQLRSFEKLTAAGMTFLEVDVVEVLEAGLPGRFGGGPGHYQLVEAEADGGGAVLRLLVDPAVGPLDPGEVGEAFLAAVGTRSGPERVMSEVWRTPGLLRVERRVPYRTATGKILAIHRLVSAAAAPPGR